MSDNLPQPDAERLIDNLETLKVYFDPLRTRIVRSIANQPRSVQDIARLLDIPFTRLYYHINMLERHGLIRLVDVKNIGGAVDEKFYQVTARSFVIDRKWLTVIDPDENMTRIEAVLSTTLDACKDDIRRAIENGKIDLTETAPHPQAIITRRGITRMTPEQSVKFQEKVLELLQEFSINAEDEPDDGTYYGLSIHFYPMQLPESVEDDSE